MSPRDCVGSWSFSNPGWQHYSRGRRWHLIWRLVVGGLSSQCQIDLNCSPIPPQGEKVGFQWGRGRGRGWGTADNDSFIS